jgi:hypothetical protein
MIKKYILGPKISAHISAFCLETLLVYAKNLNPGNELLPLGVNTLNFLEYWRGLHPRENLRSSQEKDVYILLSSENDFERFYDTGSLFFDAIHRRLN